MTATDKILGQWSFLAGKSLNPRVFWLRGIDPFC
jgi:hypothetical protein